MPGLEEDTADTTTLPIHSQPSKKATVFTQITALIGSTIGAAPHVVLATVFVLLAIIGGIASYTPVPTWDMWDGYMAFYSGVRSGDYGWWWAQHNEHRLVFSKVLFWIDLSWFHGTLVFLDVMNYVLAGLVLVLFVVILIKALPSKADKRLVLIAAAVMCAFLFSWSQAENLVWAFQSAYWVAMLFPLLAFYLLYVSTINAKRSIFYFAGACGLGVVSVGTLAAGVLVLPLMTVVAGIVKLGWRRVVCLGLLSMTTSYLYFHNYVSPRPDLPSPLRVVLTQPAQLLSYVLVYLGAPFYVMTGQRGPLVLTLLAGVLFIASVAYFAWQAVKAPQRNTVQLMVLVAFSAYIIMSGALTASGRIEVGVESAETISRYRTPPFMAWAALLILGVSYFYRELTSRPYLLSGLIILPLLLLPEQLHAKNVSKNGDFELVVAALALEMDVRDKPQIQGNLYPRIDQVFAAAGDTKAHNWSIFGNDRIRDVSQTMGTSPPQKAIPACLGALELRTPVQDDPRFAKVEGWIYAPQENRVPESVAILDGSGRVVGHAVTGKYRPDLGVRIQGHDHAGFKGYVLTESGGVALSLEGLEPGCELPLSGP